MCTLVIRFQPDQRWPLLLAGNRDEMRSRESLPPAGHWPGMPGVTAGLDRLAGGTWLGINREGVVASVMNREGTLGPASGKRSRGELVLKALEHTDAEQSVRQLLTLPAGDYRAFNLFIGDRRHCFWLRNREEEEGNRLQAFAIEPGLHMLTSRELDDTGHPRIGYWLPRFLKTASPRPDLGDWRGWIEHLSARQGGSPPHPHAAMNMSLPNGFSTVSSSLIALPREAAQAAPVWLYADGAPDRAPFLPVDLATPE
ncbi:MAG: NRDE family protein [Sedimenticola sp.]|nr:NRDE family protein [Sedimenticola sp.]